jgi:hypothetical protein
MVSTTAPPYIACQTCRYVQVSSVFTALSWLAMDQQYNLDRFDTSSPRASRDSTAR